MRKWHKLSALILGFLILSVVILRINLEDILLNRLNKLVKQDKNSLYDYKYTQLELDISSGNVILSNLSIKPKTEIIDSLDQLNLAKEKIFDIELKEFKLMGLGVFEFLLNGTISLEEINFESPKLKVYENLKYKNKEAKAPKELGTEKEFFTEIISSGLKEARIGELAFQNAKLQVYKVDGKDTTLEIIADSSNFKIQGILANKESMSSNELFHYDSSSVDLNNVKVYSINNYKLELGKFYKTSTKEDIHFSNIVLSPIEDKYTYMENREYQAEWFNLLIKEMTIEDLDIAEYQKTRNINASHFYINGADLEIYKDKRLKNKKAKYKPLLGEKLRMIELAMNISTISLTNTNIDYLEAEVNAEEPLHAYFKNLDIKISNFTTDSNKLALNDTLELKLKGNFMNEGEIDINLSLEVLDSSDNFKINGSLQNMKLNELNPILKNSAFIMFTDGHLSFLDFDMQGNNENIKGKLDLDYRGLYNLQILRKKSEMEERKERGRKRKSEKALLSFLASNIAPVDYNASYKHYHPGIVNFDRNTNKSIINFIINGLKSGVLDSFLHNHESLLKKMKEKEKAKKVETN